MDDAKDTEIKQLRAKLEQLSIAFEAMTLSIVDALSGNNNVPIDLVKRQAVLRKNILDRIKLGMTTAQIDTLIMEWLVQEEALFND